MEKKRGAVIWKGKGYFELAQELKKVQEITGENQDFYWVMKAAFKVRTSNLLLVPSIRSAF